ncbi:MAG: 3-phosphoshikimate 1-carboxyvinyltransferase, partial [Deltaproteobacteria bacterium]|nr:3-phosphoshikimate 1-carboxyvinyltransferase [Deltaproteobacteria bacterium]
LSAHNDHRIAMSLALLGLRQPEVSVRDLLDDPLVVRKSFPQFWNIWEQLA